MDEYDEVLSFYVDFIRAEGFFDDMEEDAFITWMCLNEYGNFEIPSRVTIAVVKEILIKIECYRLLTVLRDEIESKIE